jgi:hypothetical protein
VWVDRRGLGTRTHISLSLARTLSHASFSRGAPQEVVYSDSPAKPYHFYLNRTPRNVLGPHHGARAGRCVNVVGARMNSVGSFFRIWTERDSHMRSVDNVRPFFRVWRNTAGDVMPSLHQMRSFMPDTRCEPLMHHPSGGLPPFHPALDHTTEWFSRDRRKVRLKVDCVNANGLPGRVHLAQATAAAFTQAISEAVYRPRQVIDARMFVWHLDAIACVSTFTMVLLDTVDKWINRFFVMRSGNTFLHLPQMVNLLFEITASSTALEFSSAGWTEHLRNDIVAFHRIIEDVESRVWVQAEGDQTQCAGMDPLLGNRLARNLGIERDVHGDVCSAVVDDVDRVVVASGTRVHCPGFGVYRSCDVDDRVPDTIRRRFVDLLRRITHHFLGLQSHEFPLIWRPDATMHLSDLHRLATLCRLPPRDLLAWSDHLASSLPKLKRIAHNASTPFDGWISPEETGDVLLHYPLHPSELLGLSDRRWLDQLAALKVLPSTRSIVVSKLWDPFPFKIMAVHVDVIVAAPKEVTSQEPAAAWGDATLRSAVYHSLRCIIAGLESIRQGKLTPMETLEAEIFASAMGEPSFIDGARESDARNTPWLQMAASCQHADPSSASDPEGQPRTHVPAILRAQPFGHSGLGSREFGRSRTPTARLHFGTIDAEVLQTRRDTLLGSEHICENMVASHAKGSRMLVPDRPDIDDQVLAKLEARYAVVGGVWDADGRPERVDMKDVLLKKMLMNDKDVDYCQAVLHGAIPNCHFGAVNSSYHAQGLRLDLDEGDQGRAEGDRVHRRSTHPDRLNVCTHSLATRENYRKADFAKFKAVCYAAQSAGAGPCRVSDVLDVEPQAKDLDAIAARKRALAGCTRSVVAGWEAPIDSPFAPTVNEEAPAFDHDDEEEDDDVL